MAVDFNFHQYFGNKKLEFINSFESPYYCPNPMLTEKMSDGLYDYDRNNFYLHSRDDMKGYAENALTACDAPVEVEKIICVINHSEFDFSCKNETLVFYEDGCVVKTTERSRDFMNRVFKHAGMSYKHMRQMMIYMNGNSGHNCPYVQGKVAFMPIGGPSKKDVSWVSLSHLLEYREHPKEGHMTRLEFFNRHFLDLDIGVKRFKKRMEPAIHMYAAQHRRLVDTAAQFDVAIVQRDGRANKNVLHKGMVELPLRPVINELVLAEKMMGVTYNDWKKENPFLKDCPYADDLDKLFSV